MNRKTYLSVLCVIFIMALAACGGNGNSTPPPVETVTVSSGSGQTTVVSTGFTNPLVALVETGTTPNSGVAVTFTIVAGGGGASATFPSGASSAMATTDANGLAQSPAITANATTGAFTVTAAASGVTTPATFSLTNTAVVVSQSNFVFYLSGLNQDDGGDFYSLAGAVTIDSSGAVDGGVQDYSDGDEIISPQPSGDTITTGSLVVDASTGQGTLTLTTGNVNVGLAGVETLGVQFVNPNHALIIEFDGSGTSSGSLDLQTLPAAPVPPPSGSFAFAVTGTDPDFDSLVAGGVFTITGTGANNVASGTFDINDDGTVSQGVAISSGTANAPTGAFGRGTLVDTPLAATINYYIVGPEVLRLIDVDTTGATAVGSAYGQGAATFTNASLGASVFSLESNIYGFAYAAAGEFSTTQAAVKPAGISQGILSNTFSGYADDNEEGDYVPAALIGGTYAIGVDGVNGYGTLTITPDDLGDISLLGIYLVDPTLNINDPNNTTTGLGGALIVDLDPVTVGTGIVIPQLDASAPFTGNYAFGAQVFNGEGEVDFVGQGNVSSGALTGTGLLNDPFDTEGLGQAATINVTGTAVPDTTSGAVGRYTMFTTPLTVVETNSGGTATFNTAIYEADGNQLLWIEGDDDSLFTGTLQFQPSLPITPALNKAKLTTNLKLKPIR
jgi:hypothetical protein